jgi:hypothetical protein
MMPVGRPIGFEWTGLDVFLRDDFFLSVGPDLMVQQTVENGAGDDRFAEHLATRRRGSDCCDHHRPALVAS